MDRYWLFAGSAYYPSGGFHDFRGRFPTADLAKAAGRELLGRNDWWHVWDVDADALVGGTRWQGYSDGQVPEEVAE